MYYSLYTLHLLALEVNDLDLMSNHPVPSGYYKINQYKAVAMVLNDVTLKTTKSFCSCPSIYATIINPLSIPF